MKCKKCNKALFEVSILDDKGNLAINPNTINCKFEKTVNAGFVIVCNNCDYKHKTISRKYKGLNKFFIID